MHNKTDNLYKKIKKKLSRYRYLKVIYKSLFNKGFFYHHIQEYFTNIKIRDLIANFERKIFNLFYKKYLYIPSSDLAKKKLRSFNKKRGK